MNSNPHFREETRNCCVILKDTFFIDVKWSYFYDCFRRELTMGLNNEEISVMKGLVLVRGGCDSVENHMPGTMVCGLSGDGPLHAGLKRILDDPELLITESSDPEDPGVKMNQNSVHIIYRDDTISMITQAAVPSVEQVIEAGIMEWRQKIFGKLRMVQGLSGINNV